MLTSYVIIKSESDLQMRKKLYVPRVEDKNRNMRMLHISSIEDMIANSMNILEPAPIDAEGNDREDGIYTSCLQMENFFYLVAFGIQVIL